MYRESLSTTCWCSLLYKFKEAANTFQKRSNSRLLTFLFLSLILTPFVIFLPGCEKETPDIALFLIRVDGKFGYIDQSGKIIIKPQFDFSDDFQEGLALAVINHRFCYINTKGKKVIKPGFDFAKDFQEGLAAIKINGKFGYIDKRGEIIIKPQFDDTSGFQEGLAVVRIGKNEGYIDKSGKIVIQPRFDSATEFREGLAAVQIRSKWVFIDKSGDTVIDLQFDHPERFQEGLLPVLIGNKWGYINKHSQVIISPQFDSAHGFSEGLAAVKIDHKWGYIDRNGRMVIDPQFEDTTHFQENLAAARIDPSIVNQKSFDPGCGNREIVQNLGTNVIPSIQKHIVFVNEAINEQQIASKTGPIPVNGKDTTTVLDSKADSKQYTTRSFENGIANRQIPSIIHTPPTGAGMFLKPVNPRSKWGYIDRIGRIVIKPQFDDATYFRAGLAAVGIRVGNKDKWGYTDKNGRYVWSPTE